MEWISPPIRESWGTRSSVLEVPSDNYYPRLISGVGGSGGGRGGGGRGGGTSVAERSNTCSLQCPTICGVCHVTIIMSGTQCSGAFTGHS